MTSTKREARAYQPPTRTVRLLHLADKTLRPLARHSVWATNALNRLAKKRELTYCLANARLWRLPTRLERYPGILKILEKAHALGFEIYSLPQGWFGHSGDRAVTYLLGKRVVIFIENRPIEAVEATDIVLHEIVHGTGVLLGRLRDSDIFEKTSEQYWFEDAVAMVAAQRIAIKLDLPRLAGKKVLIDDFCINVVQSAGKVTLDRTKIKAKVDEVMAYLGMPNVDTYKTK